MNKINRYKLIKPVISHKIHETTSIKKGSKKCYNELLELKIEGVNTFTVLDVDSQKMFTFKINNPYVGESTQKKVDSIIDANITNFDKDDIASLININEKNSQHNQNNEFVQNGGNIHALENKSDNLSNNLSNKLYNKLSMMEADLKVLMMRISNIENKLK